MPKVSVTVITLNEEANLAAALETVSWADEIVVVDAHSTDRTTAVARQFTDRVVTREWRGYVDQKNYAASLAAHDWILSLDADERVSAPLAEEIRTRLQDDRAAAGAAAFRVPRVTWHLGRWIRSTDWYPDYQVRLYDRRRARWTGGPVHEGITADGPIEPLHSELQHHAYSGIADHLDTINRYTTLAAAEMDQRGRRAGLFQLAAHPPLAFLRNFVARRGFRDGAVGFVISALNAYYVFLKFAKLWERQRRG